MRKRFEVCEMDAIWYSQGAIDTDNVGSWLKADGTSRQRRR